MIRITYREGRGRLVLIGGASGYWATTEAIDRAAVAAMPPDRPIAFLPAANCEPEYGTSFLERYRQLGAPAGTVVPVHDAASARDPANARLLAEAGLIYIGGGETPALLASLGGSPALDAMVEAYESGAVICAASAGAIALASWGVSINPEVGLLRGWGWLERTVVSPHHTRERAAALDAALGDMPELAGVGLPDDVALALGPDGSMETWGAGRVTFVAGERFAV